MATEQRNNQADGGGSSPRMWTRRDVLLRGGQTVVAAGVVAGAAWYLHDPEGDAGLKTPEPIRLPDYFRKVDFAASAPRMAVSYGRPGLEDDLPHVRDMIDRALLTLDSDGIGKFIARNDVVMIKPNVGFDRGPKLGATTNPAVVRAVVQLCRKAGARKVIIADNPIESPAACFAKSGIQAAAEAENADVMIHSSVHDVPVAIRTDKPDPARGEALGTWPIFWKPLREADKVIGIAPVKDHNLCYASMLMKNWYGLLSGRRNQFHQAIHDIVSDLGLMMKPTLVIADGTRVMMQHGPTGGRLEDVKVGGIVGRPTVAVSVDQLACDSWCYQNLLGRDPAALAYLDLAYQKFGQDPSRLVSRSWQEYRDQGKLIENNVG